MDRIYSVYAETAKEAIQTVNETLQLCVNQYCLNNITQLDDHSLDANEARRIKTQIIDCMDHLDGIIDTYFNHIIDYYNSLDEDETFSVSVKLKDVVSGYFDTINFESPLDILPEITFVSFMKYLNTRVIYNSIIDLLFSDKSSRIYSERIYKADHIVTMVEFIFSYFEDWKSTVDQVCSPNSTMSSVFKYYMCELHLIIYIIALIESIKQN